MTIYERPKAEVFAQDAPPSEIQPFQAWVRGLGIAFDETNGFPEMTGLNGLFNALNLYIKYLEQNGFSEWRSDMEYPAGAGVRVGLIWYRAKTQNTNKPPATSQTDWELFLNASALSYSEPLYLDGSTIKIRDASTTQKGATQFANATEIANKQNISKVVNPANVASIAQSTDLGVGQPSQNLTSSRSLNSTYTNNTGKPILVYIQVGNYLGGVSAEASSLIVSGVTIPFSGGGFDSSGALKAASITWVIENGETYRVTSQTSGRLLNWTERR